jgi:hypothetical protein
MIEKLVQQEVQQFILDHEQDDERQMVLTHETILGLPASIIAEQLSARRKAKTKLPLYYNTTNIIYPPGLNLEQSSSEKTAQFKAKVLSTMPQLKLLADATGGLGIDSFYLSKTFETVYHIEPNMDLQQIAQHNHTVLQAKNIHYVNSRAEPFINQSDKKFDCIFIDPSRRKVGQKVFRLSDCEPNIASLLPVFFDRSNYVLIKTSPLLDIQQGLQELANVEKIWVLAVDNECKELLFLCHKGFSGEPEITAVNMRNTPETFSFFNSSEKASAALLSDPLLYIYEPNAALLKAGAFKILCKSFSVFKLHASTHLYTSSMLIENFPGRIFKNLQRVRPDAKALAEIFPEGKANIITRNYPLSVDALRRKTKLKDGGYLYLLGFSGSREKYLIAAERVK